MARSPQDPAVELRIAAAGPAVSVVLGGAFAAVAMLAGVSMWPPTLYGGGFLAREEAAATLHERVKNLRVSDVMIREPVTVSPDAPAALVAEALWHGAQREFPVVTARGVYAGLVTAGALLRAGPGSTVGEVADAAAPILAPEDALETSGLLSGELSAAAVVSAGRVVGLARAADAALLAQEPVQQPKPVPTPRHA